mmetsp:Transcript_7237/g.11803  ORF Transcript_7237/g.11803 Transcript_7237/m.11803 type:complete len:86 (-) Transcript_7237:2196-2453(-)
MEARTCLTININVLRHLIYFQHRQIDYLQRTVPPDEGAENAQQPRVHFETQNFLASDDLGRAGRHSSTPAKGVRVAQVAQPNPPF